MNMLRLLLTIATVSTGLLAGLMYAYYCSVNPGLASIGDREYIIAMQGINRAILNPVFFSTFMGTLFLLPLSAWLLHAKTSSTCFVFIATAAVVYGIGVFAVTLFGNVPLNEALDKFNLAASSAAEIREQRVRFAMPWNTLHKVRTMASVVAFVLMILSCLSYGEGIGQIEKTS